MLNLVYITTYGKRMWANALFLFPLILGPLEGLCDNVMSVHKICSVRKTLFLCCLTSLFLEQRLLSHIIHFVTGAAFVHFVVLGGCVFSFGVYFKPIQERFNATAAEVAWMPAVMSCTALLIGKSVSMLHVYQYLQIGVSLDLLFTMLVSRAQTSPVGT